jgi:hypothetical protein
MSHLSSEALAQLVADALLYAKLIRDADFATVAAIIAEELDARKAVGDY